MNKEMKTKWLEALRSGKYDQGQGKLCVANQQQAHLIAMNDGGEDNITEDFNEIADWIEENL